MPISWQQLQKQLTDVNELLETLNSRRYELQKPLYRLVNLMGQTSVYEGEKLLPEQMYISQSKLWFTTEDVNSRDGDTYDYSIPLSILEAEDPEAAAQQWKIEEGNRKRTAEVERLNREIARLTDSRNAILEVKA